MTTSNGDLIENRYGITAESKQYARGYDEGFSCGYHYGVLDGFGRGFDAGLEEAARE